jgi:phthiocerol/phenolphthiocerol synthesis type-I polyketide synthase C
MGALETNMAEGRPLAGRVTCGAGQRPAPIAVVGIGCRFPGAHGPQRFWQLLVDAVDALDADRGAGDDGDGDDAVRQSLAARPGEPELPRGGRLRNVDEFDAEFFGMSPREAQRTDPQARLLLETTWEALEDAGLNPDQLAGTLTGVFVGQAASNYWDLVRQVGPPDIHTVVGSEVRASLPGRICFAFDLRGPSVSVDTACSASLTAVHQACQSIRAGDSSVAIVGGVNLALLPDEGIAYSGANLLAADGRCKFADASADGFVRSDGIGVVVLKPLDAAVADGDRVYASILGSAINNDGRSGGTLMTPGVTGQEDLLRQAYRRAGVAPSEVAYVEAHGTGTSTGDRVELTALANVLAEGRAGGPPCLVGSVKTNIGHAEAAAGIAGLIKTALCLFHRTIPPSLHFREPNPAIRWEAMPLAVPTGRMALPDGREPAIAGVSSFGISGANAHVVLAEHHRAEHHRLNRAAPAGPPPAGAPPAAPPADPQVLLLSAHSPEALRDSARSYADFLGPCGAGRELDLRDICRTAALRRKHLPSRLAVVGESHDEAERRLRDYLADPAAGAAVSSPAPAAHARVAFAFPGQGSQWRGMGQDLLRTCEVFRAAMRSCDEAIQAETGVSVLRELEGEGARLAEVDILQPALWAIEVALAAVFRSLGLEPDLVVGHSMGEVAALHVAGVLDLPDAAAVICRRSRLARQLSGRGAMAAVALTEDQAAELIAGCRDEVAVAACNGPSATVLSGDPRSLRRILATLELRGVAHKLLDVDFASHSPQVDAIEGDLRQVLHDIRPRPGQISVHSTVTGGMLDGSSCGAGYWVDNLRQPVRFTSAISQIGETAPTLFLEISPHPTLVGAIRDSLGHRGLAGTAVESMRRQRSAWPCLLESLARVHVLGGHVDWERLNGSGRSVPLPTYAWQRQRHWLGGGGRPGPAAVSPADPQFPSRAFELTGDLRLLDPARQTVVEMSGARLQFVATGLSGVPGGQPSGASTGPEAAPESPAESPAEPPLPAAAEAGDAGDAILGEVARVLALPAGRVDTGKSLQDMGLDSLMAGELAARLRRNLGVSVHAGSLLTNHPLAEVVAAVRAAAR